MNVPAFGAPPNNDVAELFVYRAQLCGTPLSSFLNMTLNALPAATPKHVLSNPDPLAPVGAVMVRSVPDSGWHGAADPEAVGWATEPVGAGEGENARARVCPAATVATSRFLFRLSNQATASVLP